MKSSEKKVIIDRLTEHIKTYNHFYLTDLSGLNAGKTRELRRRCFKEDVKLVVVKNTMLRKALEQSGKDASELYDILKGNTSVMFSDNGNVPAKLIKEFKKVYKGTTVKSKNELIAEVVALLQSPIKTVLSQLQSGANIIHGVLKTLGEKE